MRILLSSLLFLWSFSLFGQTLAERISSMTAENLPPVSDFSSLSPDQLPAVIDAINRLPGEKMPLLTVEHYAAIGDLTQFQRLGGNIFSAQRINELAALKTDQEPDKGIARLSATQISQIASNQFIAVTAASLSKLSDGQFQALSGVQILNLSPNVWNDSAMSSRLNALSPDLFSSLSREAALSLKNLPNGAYSRLTAAQKAAVDARAALPAAGGDAAADASRADGDADVASDSGTDNANDYKAETCQWVGELPRRVVAVRGRLARTSCGTSGASNSCVGFVSCERKESSQRLIRMSSCSSNLCGEGDAIRCTQDRSRASAKPQDEDIQTIRDNTTIRVQQQ